MLQAKTEKQREFIRSKLADVASWVGTINEDRVELDGWVDFDQMAEIVDYLREQNKSKQYGRQTNTSIAFQKSRRTRCKMG